MTGCAVCAHENPVDAKFCMECAAPLGAPAVEVRKIVTAVFCDLVGSTSLGESLDAEVLRHVMSRYFAAMTEAIERHGGTVEKFIGDAVMAVFGVPIAHEDDALRAVRAAAAMRDALQALAEGFESEQGISVSCRIGVHTGEVVAGEHSLRQALVTGDAVNVAARLEQAAPPMGILISEQTYRLVRDAVRATSVEPLVLKGKTMPVPALLLLDVRSDAPGLARRLDMPMVGRDRELDRFVAAFERSSRLNESHLFTVVGEPGAGKTRFLAEIRAVLRERATVLVGRCPSYGDALGLWPLVEIVRSAFPGRLPTEEILAEVARMVSDDPDASVIGVRMAQLVGGEADAAPSEEVAWALGRFLEALARRRPVVVSIDDLQWGNDALLDLVGRVARRISSAPLILTCAARPDLLERRPDWGAGIPHATLMPLEPLTSAESIELIEHLLGGGVLDPVTSGAVVAEAGGNPLFLEQTLAMFLDEGSLAQDGQVWIRRDAGVAVPVPSSVQAVLTARLDRLDATDRAVLAAASVVGHVFDVDSVRAVVRGCEPAEVGVSLQRLSQRDLVVAERSDLPGDDAFRFAHPLLEEAAYRTCTKRYRAEAHEALATRLVSRPEGVAELLVAHHLDRAATLRLEFAPHDARSQRLAERAVDALSAAAHRGSGRGSEMRARLLGRAVALRPSEDPVRTWDLIDLAYACNDRNDHRGAATWAAEALRSAGSGDDALAEAHALLADVIVRYESGDRLEQVLREVTPVFEAHADRRGLMYACNAESNSHNLDCHQAQAAESMKRAAEHARVLGEADSELAFTWVATEFELLGPTPVAAVSRDVEIFSELARPYPSYRRAEFRLRALLDALLGEHGAAQREIESAKAAALEWVGWVGEATWARGWFVATLAADHVRAATWIEAACRQMEATGGILALSTGVGLWARSCYHLGRYAEAHGLAERCRALSDAGDIANELLWPPVTTMLLARDGRFPDAAPLIERTLAAVERTDVLVDHAWAMSDLAEAYRLAGRRHDASAMLSRALDAAERKGSPPLIEQVHRQIAKLA